MTFHVGTVFPVCDVVVRRSEVTGGAGDGFAGRGPRRKSLVRIAGFRRLALPLPQLGFKRHPRRGGGPGWGVVGGSRGSEFAAPAALTSGRPPTLNLPHEGEGDNGGANIWMFHSSRPAKGSCGIRDDG